MVADGNTHILFVGGKARFTTTVPGQDIMLLEHIDDNLTGSIGRQDFTKEIVSLGGHDTEERDGAQLTSEVVTLCHELGTGTLVVFLVFIVNLHVELCERVEVPDAHLFLDGGYQPLVCGGEDTQT
jgi:hypothetical protein